MRLQWLDAHPQHISRLRIIRLLVAIAHASRELPQTLFLTGVNISSRDPTIAGSSSDIFFGTYNQQKIALKRLRLTNRGTARSQAHRVGGSGRRRSTS
jgi:hypothetical protein